MKTPSRWALAAETGANKCDFSRSQDEKLKSQPRLRLNEQNKPNFLPHRQLPKIRSQEQMDMELVYPMCVLHCSEH